MPSPFPGMNPYLEQEDAWHDFHERFMPMAAAMLEPQVGDDYIVKIDETVYIHEAESNQREMLGRADVFVSQAGGAPRSTATALFDSPATVTLPTVDVERDSVVEIRDRRSRQLVTVIELLSPTNKRPSKYRDQYLAKRGRILASPTHFVEIDLLRGGPRMPIDDLPACDYCVVVSRAEDRPRAALWPIRLREPLPSIPIPLREADRLPRLDLQGLLQRIYDDAGYQKYIYDERPDPPLGRKDAAWAKSLLPKMSPLP
jgi:hypothetical protein